MNIDARTGDTEVILCRICCSLRDWLLVTHGQPEQFYFTFKRKIFVKVAI